MPGAGPEHQAGLATLARGVMLGRTAWQEHAAWGMRLGREQREAERAQRAQEEERARQERRQRQGLPPEPKHEKERDREGPSLGR